MKEMWKRRQQHTKGKGSDEENRKMERTRIECKAETLNELRERIYLVSFHLHPAIVNII